MGMGKKQEFRFLQLLRRKVRNAVESVRGYAAVQNKRMPVSFYIKCVTAAIPAAACYNQFQKKPPL